MQKFALLLLVAISALAAEDPIANTATKELPAKGIPGAVVVIVRDGQIAYGQGFGRLSAERDTPMTADALFRVGSCTKMITALTAVSLANEHGIPLDAAVGRYVSGLSPRLSQVTLQQLLTHTAGIHDEIVATPLEQHADESELLREVRSWTDATFFTDPGDIFSYSNLGFVLIGAFIEQVSGHRYADEVTARVLRPLGITDATFRPETAVTYPFAQGHIGLRSEAPKVVRPIKTDVRHWPAGFLWASAVDYARVAIALMDHGMIDGKQALDRGVVDAVITPRVAMPEIKDLRYAFGLIVAEQNGVETVGHGGRMEGYNALVTTIPARHAAVIVFTNRMDTGAPATRNEALKLVAPELIREPEKESPPATVNGAELAGVYVNGAERVVVGESAGGLTMSVDARHGALRATDVDRFSWAFTNDEEKRSANAVVVFVRRAGAVRYVVFGERAYRRSGSATKRVSR